MASKMLLNALSITNGYLVQNYSKSELKVIREEIENVLGKETDSIDEYSEMYSYEEVQEILSNINEKEDIRKVKGVYYTPVDIVKFILFNSVKMVCGRLKPNNIHVLDLNGIPYSSFCYEKNCIRSNLWGRSVPTGSPRNEIRFIGFTSYRGNKRKNSKGGIDLKRK